MKFNDFWEGQMQEYGSQEGIIISFTINFPLYSISFQFFTTYFAQGCFTVCHSPLRCTKTYIQELLGQLSQLIPSISLSIDVIIVILKIKTTTFGFTPLRTLFTIPFLLSIWN